VRPPVHDETISAASELLAMPSIQKELLNERNQTHTTKKKRNCHKTGSQAAPTIHSDDRYF